MIPKLKISLTEAGVKICGTDARARPTRLPGPRATCGGDRDRDNRDQKGDGERDVDRDLRPVADVDMHSVDSCIYVYAT